MGPTPTSRTMKKKDTPTCFHELEEYIPGPNESARGELLGPGDASELLRCRCCARFLPWNWHCCCGACDDCCEARPHEWE